MIDLVGNTTKAKNPDQHIMLTHLSNEVSTLGTQPVLLGGLGYLSETYYGEEGKGETREKIKQ